MRIEVGNIPGTDAAGLDTLMSAKDFFLHADGDLVTGEAHVEASRIKDKRARVRSNKKPEGLTGGRRGGKQDHNH